MSGLTDAERVDARRFAGYPIYGSGAIDDPFFRFTASYMQLENHLVALTDAEVAVARRYLTTLGGLELAIPGVGENLDTDQAAVWKHNPNELADRERLYATWRRRFCGFLGVPPGPDLRGSSNTARLIV